MPKKQNAAEHQPKPVSLRFRPGLHTRARDRAILEGKSLNEMMNDLVERGLDMDRQLSAVYGSVNGHAVARALLAAAEAAVTRYGADQGLWLYDSENFDRAAAAMRQMLETLRPVPEAQEAQEALAKIDTARKRYLHLVGKQQSQAA